MTVEEVVQALLILFGGALGAEAIRSVVQRRKMRADIATELTAGSMVLLKPLRTRVEELEAEASKLRADLVDARTECDGLRSELHHARLELAEIRGAVPPEGPHRH